MRELLLEHVSVDYPVKRLRSATLMRAMHSLTTGGAIRQDRSHLNVEALRDVSLRLAAGDRVGILGHNGAGKTTLLRVLAGILPPTAGRVRIEGVVSALLSIQLGLDEEESGLNNIVIRARFMGQSERKIAESINEIAEFTELGEYLSFPLKTYSSGMRLRLAFSIATAFEPDILILDEWLSAGDRSFRDKAEKRLESLIARSGIFVFASHTASLLSRMCNKGLVMEHGRVAFFGPVEEAMAVYDEKMGPAPEVQAAE